MNVKMDDDGAFRWINQMLVNIPASIRERERLLLRNAGKILKNNVKAVMRRSDVEEAAVKVEPKNYDSSRPYVHMQDEVSYKVKKSKTGALYVSVRGGKMTGYKWHLVNDGTINTNPTHFIEAAESRSEAEIEKAIDVMIKEALDGW